MTRADVPGINRAALAQLLALWFPASMTQGNVYVAALLLGLAVSRDSGMAPGADRGKPQGQELGGPHA